MMSNMVMFSILGMLHFASAQEPATTGPGFAWRFSGTELKCYTPTHGSAGKTLKEADCPPPKLEYGWGIDKRNGDKKCHAFLSGTRHVVETIYGKEIVTTKKCDKMALPEPAIAGDGFSWKIRSANKDLICYKTFAGSMKGEYKADNPNCPPPKLNYKWGINKKGEVKCQAFLAGSNVAVLTVYESPINTTNKCDKTLLPKDELNFQLKGESDNTVNSSRTKKIVPAESDEGASVPVSKTISK